MQCLYTFGHDIILLAKGLLCFIDFITKGEIKKGITVSYKKIQLWTGNHLRKGQHILPQILNVALSKSGNRK